MKTIDDSKMVRAWMIIKIFLLSHSDDLMKIANGKKMSEDIKEDSFISQLINEHKWEELFSNEDWLCILHNVENMAIFHKNEEIEKRLKIFSDYFPKETMGYVNQ